MHALVRLLVCASIALAAGCDKTEGDDENVGTDENTDSEGGLLSTEEFQELCDQQGSRESCEAVPGQIDEAHSESWWCAWVVEVPAQLDGEVCTFGEPVAACRVSQSSEVGCSSPSLDACPSNDLGWSRMDGETIVIGRGALCAPPADFCSVSSQSDVMGAPECACLCDPDFPL